MTDSQKILLTTGVTVGLAFIGYLVTYINSLRLSQRAERLARVNRQLAELYGPLFALTGLQIVLGKNSLESTALTRKRFLTARKQTLTFAYGGGG